MWGSGEGRPGRGGSAPLPLSSTPTPLHLMGQDMGGGDRKPQDCRRSHFLPHPRKGEGPTASSPVGVGAGRAGSRLYLGGWVSPSMLPATHTH